MRNVDRGLHRLGVTDECVRVTTENVDLLPDMQHHRQVRVLAAIPACQYLLQVRSFHDWVLVILSDRGIDTICNLAAARTSGATKLMAML